MQTPVSHEQMDRMFETQKETILEITHLNAKAINAKTIAETDRISVKLDNLILKQAKANNNVAENVKAIAKNNKTIERVNRFSGNVKWYIIGLFGFCYSVAWIYDSFNLKEIIEKLIFKL